MRLVKIGSPSNRLGKCNNIKVELEEMEINDVKNEKFSKKYKVLLKANKNAFRFFFDDHIEKLKNEKPGLRYYEHNSV
jgi:hypothetical protein